MSDSSLDLPKTQSVRQQGKPVARRLGAVSPMQWSALFSALAAKDLFIVTAATFAMQLFSKVSSAGYYLIDLPMQVYWTQCLYKLQEGLGAAANTKVSLKPITILSFVNFALIPVFSNYLTQPSREDPFFVLWELAQLSVTLYIGNCFDNVVATENGKKGFRNRVEFTLLGNGYILLGQLYPSLLSNSVLLGVLWFCSQFAWIGWASGRLRSLGLSGQPEPSSASARELAFVSGEDIEIKYRALPAIERWLQQRFSGTSLNKGVKIFVMTLLAPVLVMGGVSLAGGLFEFARGAAQTATSAAGQQAATAGPSVAGYLPLICLVALLSMFAILILIYILKNKPTHLYLNAHGFGLLWKKSNGQRRSSLSINWASVSHIKLHKPSGQASNLNDELWFQQADGRVFKIKLNAIDSFEEKEWILKAIKTWAPSVSRDAAVLQSLQPPADYSYTELWLQALSAPPQRERLKPLVSGVRLKQGKYLVDRALGVGGQGTAYLASELIGGETVVLKEFILPVFVDVNVRKSALEQFENEARILRQLNNPQVVKLIDYFVEDHRAYLVLEHIDGESLQKVVKERGRLSEPQVLLLAKQMCSILCYLHGLSPPVVHRDFTPDNLILSTDGTLKLIDFNVAQQQESTSSGTVVGKQAYLPPEQFRGMPCAQSDIYAMGASLYFLLTGQDPEPISVSRPALMEPSISQSLNSVVEHATATDLKKRYASIQQLQDDLLLLLTHVPLSSNQ